MDLDIILAGVTSVNERFTKIFTLAEQDKQKLFTTFGSKKSRVEIENLLSRNNIEIDTYISNIMSEKDLGKIDKEVFPYFINILCRLRVIYHRGTYLMLALDNKDQELFDRSIILAKNEISELNEFKENFERSVKI